MMRQFGLLSVLFVISFGLASDVHAQSEDSTSSIRRTPWGDPDLQGMWPTSALMAVPFERPRAIGTRTVLSEEELAARARSFNALVDGASDATNVEVDLVLALRLMTQMSLVVDPEDGRLPPMTDDGARRAQEWRTKASPAYAYAGSEDLRPYDRCITRGVLGSAFPNIYASAVQILQSPGFVVIHYETIHESRIIPLDRRPHIGSGIRQWMGDSRGQWDGDTLVVETTNFNGRTGSYWRNGDGNPTSEALRLVERFRLSDTQTLQYEVHVEDTQTWTRPWTVAFPVSRDEGFNMYEYACHEGNYALVNILRGVRAAERSDGP